MFLSVLSVFYLILLMISHAGAYPNFIKSEVHTCVESVVVNLGCQLDWMERWLLLRNRIQKYLIL